MSYRLFKTFFASILVAVRLASPNPVLTLGTWVDITPPDPQISGEGGANYVSDIQFDASNPSILYSCNNNKRGLEKSTNGGATWTVLGANGGVQLISAFRVRVDPVDGKRLYLIQGVSGQGFFRSTDAGATWEIPAGWTTLMDSIHEDDMYNIAVDPTNFKHVLISFYLDWSATTWYTDNGNAGIVESTDGGDTWVTHQPRSEWASDHCYNVAFLYDPAGNLGNSQTWVFSNRSSGIWRTTDAGNNWTQVSSTQQVTRSQYYYTKAGVLYGAANLYPIRSTDNGVTWQSVSNGLPYNYYYSMGGDGNQLYTLPYQGGAILVSPETDGLTWKPFNNQTFPEGANGFTYDSASKIMYVAAKSGGLWALKVANSATHSVTVRRAKTGITATEKRMAYVSKDGIAVPTGNMGVCDIRGRILLNAK